MKQRAQKVNAGPLPARKDIDVLFIPAVVRKSGVSYGRVPMLDRTQKTRLRELDQAHTGLASVGTIDTQVLPATSRLKRLALISVGDEIPAPLDRVRDAAAAACEWCRKTRARQVAVAEDCLIHLAGVEAVSAWVEGFVMAGFSYNAMRSVSDPSANSPQVLLVATRDTPGAGLKRAVHRAKNLAEAVNLTRFLGHEPPNVINPVTLAQRCKSLARKHGLRCRVLDDRQLAARKMNAIVAVGQGSKHRSRMIILEHTGGKPQSRPLVLVGKAVTLDTGGYCIKPGSSIPDMKYDKQGGMTVIGALVAAATMKLKRRIIGVVGAAENMISGDAFRPGDIVRALNGKSIEVINTDAEGRLVLADCLTYAERTWKPSAMIDLATLTGAVELALGNACAGLMANNDDLANALIASGERVHERLWRLPLWPVYREQIAGTDADIKNVGGRPAGAITAGMFLKEFVSDKTPWAHLDIAAVAATSKPRPICPVGATGFGVRLLLDYIERRK